MHYRRSIARAAVAVLALVAGVVAIPATPAQADQRWQPIAIAGIDQPNFLLPQVDGGVSVGCSSTGTTAFKTYGPTGAVIQSRATSSNPAPNLCAQTTAVGKDGTLFVAGQTNNFTAWAVQAFKNNAQVWKYTIPCQGVPQAMVVGPNSNVYLTTTDAQTPCTQSRLVGLTPTASPGTSTPQVVLNISLTGTPNQGGLAAYDSGFVVRFSDGIRYVETPNTVGNLLGGSDVMGQYGESYDATLNGRVFLASRASSGVSTGCSYAYDTAGSISAFDPSGSPWSIQLQACSMVYELRPTPRGGLIAHIRRETTPGSGDWDDRLLAYDNTGSNLWSVPLPTPDGNNPQVANSFAVDLHGNVAVQSSITSVGVGNNWYPWVSFSYLNGASGATQSHVEVNADTQSWSGPNYKLTATSQPRIGPDTAYMSLQPCTTAQDCSGVKLYALTVPGLTLDYPRGALLKFSEPWKNYVAMGDSFSSGEGVPPFTSPSNTDGCHRSGQAYSQLLTNDAQLRWRQTAFVACSGATTSDVIAGKNGEASQLSALNASIDVVTISIGGNDVQFVEFASQCVGWPEIDPLRICDASNPQYTTTMDKIDNVLPGNLTRTTVGNEGVLRRIRQAAPNAHVYVIGYPQLAPASTEPHEWPWCSWLNSDSEHVAAREVVNRLNLRIQQAVDAMGTGFTFIDPNNTGSPFIGHELCDGATYFNGPTLPKEYSLHPNQKGQSAYAQLVRTYV